MDHSGIGRDVVCWVGRVYLCTVVCLIGHVHCTVYIVHGIEVQCFFLVFSFEYSVFYCLHCTVYTTVYTNYIILNNGILKSNSSVFLWSKGYILQYTPRENSYEWPCD